MLFLKRCKTYFASIALCLFAFAASGIAIGASNVILFEDDFETCNYQKFAALASNKIDLTISHSGKCSSKIGGVSTDFIYGKLIATLPSGQSELWFRAYVFFPLDFQLQAGAPWNSGIHLIRFWGERGMQLDFNVPSRYDTIQLFHHPGTIGGPEAVRYTSYNPAGDGRRGRWQCWEVHSRLNQPGQSDGLVEFYVDGAFVDSVSGNFRGNTAALYSSVDFQSNIGSPNPGWPSQNWWYIDDVVVSTGRVGCPTGLDKTPPRPPAGLRVTGQ